MITMTAMCNCEDDGFERRRESAEEVKELFDKYREYDDGEEFVPHLYCRCDVTIFPSKTTLRKGKNVTTRDGGESVTYKCDFKSEADALKGLWGDDICVEWKHDTPPPDPLAHLKTALDYVKDEITVELYDVHVRIIGDGIECVISRKTKEPLWILSKKELDPANAKKVSRFLFFTQHIVNKACQCAKDGTDVRVS